MRRPLIIDGRNLLDPRQARAAGFAYEGIGRPGSPVDVLPRPPSASRRRLVEAIILAGGKAERLGDAAAGQAEGARRRRGPSARRVPGRAARRPRASTA